MKKTFFTLVLLISSLLSFSLNVPSLSSPSNVAVNQNPNVTLSIGSVTGATSYDYEIDINSDFLSSVVINRTSTTCPLSELLFGQTYYWRARARNATETSDWSAHRSFTIINTVFLSNPSNGATDRNPNVALSWSTITGLTHYGYQYDTSPEFDSPNLFSRSVASNYTSVSTSNLLFGETYYWRVRARHDVDHSGWSDVRNFTVINTVYLSNPSNGAIDCSPNVALSWNTVTGLTHYDYQYDTSPAFDSPNLFSGSVTSNFTSVSTSNLLFGETYYWRVRARHDVDHSGWSDVRSFTVINTVYLSNPSNGAIDCNPNVALSWSTITGLTHYDYQYDTSPAFDSPNLFSGSVASNYTSVSTSNLLFGETYYWRVRARHDVDHSGWSDVRSFTVINTVYLSNPSNGAIDRSPNVALSWNTVTGLTHYDYQYDTSSDFDSPNLFSGAVTSNYTSVSTGNLLFGETYFWRVRARHDLDQSGWSEVRSFTVINTVYLGNPSNGAIDRNPNVALSWTTVTGLTHYDYQYDTSSDFDSPNLFSGAVTSNYTSVSTSNLLFGETYYWRVRARHDVDQSGWSDVRSFTVINTVYLSGPANGNTLRPVNQVLSWNSITGLTHYDYNYDTSDQFDSPNYFFGSVTSNYTSVSTANLMYGTNYHWRIKARHSLDESEWSAVWNFTTNPLGAVQGSPSNNATNRPINLTLSVSITSGSSNIDYQLDTTPNFNSPLLREYTHTNSFSGQTVSNLRYGQTYYWRVRGRHTQDISQWSSVWSFTTQYELTTSPILSSPSNASTDIPYVNLNLIWNSIPNANSYQYQVSENASFTQVVKSGNTSLTFTSITNLYPATVYYWRVRGENENGYSPWSDVWSFTTQSVTLDPPQLISPADGSIVANSDVNFTWGSVFGASGYTLQVSLSNEFAAGTSTFNTSNTSYTVTGFPFNLTFFWRVRATDAFNEGDWSEVWSFSTVEPTLSPPNLILPLNSSSDLDFSETIFEWSIVDGATLYTIEIPTAILVPMHLLSVLQQIPILLLG